MWNSAEKMSECNRIKPLLTGGVNFSGQDRDLLKYSLMMLRNADTVNLKKESPEVFIGKEELLTQVFPEKNSSNIMRDMKRSRAALKEYAVSDWWESDSENQKLISDFQIEKNGIRICFSEAIYSYIDENAEIKPEYNTTHILSSTGKAVYEFLEREWNRMKKDVTVCVDMTEFRIAIGLIDPNDKRVRGLLEEYPLRDDAYDPMQRAKLMMELEKIDNNLSVREKHRRNQVCRYSDWRNFKKFCLDNTRSELEDQDSFPIQFEYEPIQCPGSRKIIALKFRIWEKESWNVKRRGYEREKIRRKRQQMDDIMMLFD